MSTPLDNFLINLDALITATESGPVFRGKTQALKALRRVRNLSVFANFA